MMRHSSLLTLCTLFKPNKSVYFLSQSTTIDRVNYYKILDMDSGATQSSIRQAYARLTRLIQPQKHSKQFRQLNEAFVILTDHKTRDAYDSLLAVRKSYYLSQEEGYVPIVKSYLAQRKDHKLWELKKKMNIDQFGRYRGGLPNKFGQIRGKSRNYTGVHHRLTQVQEQLDRFPETHTIDREKAESFKNYHQDDRQARTMKWPWFSFQVDYHFFSFRGFRKSYWPWIKLIVLLGYILPTFYYAAINYEKKMLTKELVQSRKYQAKWNNSEPVKVAIREAVSEFVSQPVSDVIDSAPVPADDSQSS